jgi:hypothetical protein
MEACLRACLGLGIIRLVQSYGQERLCFDRHNLPAQDELVSETSDVGGRGAAGQPELEKDAGACSGGRGESYGGDIHASGVVEKRHESECSC